MPARSSRRLFVCELFAEQGADVIELESTVAPDMYRMYGDAWSVDRRNQRMMTLNIPRPRARKSCCRW